MNRAALVALALLFLLAAPPARAAPHEECHIEIVGGIYPFLRVQAQTDSPFPVVNGVTFEIRVDHQSGGALDYTVRNGGVPVL